MLLLRMYKGYYSHHAINNLEQNKKPNQAPQQC